jgi:sugar lactone lactonase YvrE
MKRALWVLLVLVAALVAYLLLWPIPVKAVAWKASMPPGYAGPHAVNTRLAGLQHIELGGEEGPEHVMIGPDGNLYTTVASGKVLRMAPDGSGVQTHVDTGGRVLGFDFDRSGRLIAADAMRGLLRVDAQGQVQVLSVRWGDDPVRYADAVVVTRQPGTAELMFFSDASTRFGASEWGGTFEASVLDILEQSVTGRVLVFDSAQGRTERVAHGLSFANGVALSEDEQTLFVAETGQYRIWAIPASARDLDLSRGPTGGARVVFDNLPGYPDNLMRGRNGRIWVGLVKPRNPVIDRMAGLPLLREITLRLPRSTWPIPKAYGHVFAFSEDGRVVVDWQDPSGAYPDTTAVTETDERVYVQSLHAKTLGWMARPGDLP